MSCVRPLVVRGLWAAFALSVSGLSSEIAAQQPPTPQPQPVQPAPVQPAPVPTPTPPQPSPTPVQPAPPTPAIVAYRTPQIAIVQPLPGGSVPQDKPVVVFRFVPGELTDPIDAASFQLSVDGVDRTSLFQIGSGEAWGPLAPAAAGSLASALTAGPHQLSARICSSRGACGTAQAPVLVLPSAATTPQQTTPPSRAQRLIELLLSAGKKILLP